MNKIQEKRLLKVAKHLETGKLGHEKFRFCTVNSGPKDARGCGTLGCAIGEFPIIFPRVFKFSEDWVRPKKENHPPLYSVVQSWFGITDQEDDHLFYPNKQEPYHFGGKILTDRATRKAVAKNIRAFIKVKNKEDT